MMKVHNSQGTTPGTEKSRKTVQVQKNDSQKVSGLTAERSSQLSDSGRISRNTLLFKILDSLVTQLDRKNSHQRTLINLLQLIKELPRGEDGIHEDTSDSRLMQKVLREWKNIHGKSLSGRQYSEYETLERLLQDRGEDRYSIILTGTNGFGEIRIKEEYSQEQPGREEGISRLDMRINLPRLGLVRVLLEKRSEGYSCLIQSDKDKTHREIKREVKSLREKIFQRGLILDSLKLQKRTLNFTSRQNPKRRGISIWG